MGAEAYILGVGPGVDAASATSVYDSGWHDVDRAMEWPFRTSTKALHVATLHAPLGCLCA